MDDLIYKSDVIQAVDKHTFDTPEGVCLDNDITCILEEIPSAQPVIRCRDCKHHEDEELGMVYCPIIVGNWVRDDWYCADAERRSDE